MFANYLAFPFVTAALLFLYLSWKVDSDYAPWMVPFIILSAVIYVLSPQINWWWYNRRPPVLPAQLRMLLERFSRFYQNLDEAGKKKFRDRIALFRMGTEWTPTGWPDDQMGPDVEMVLSVQAVMLTFNRPVFLFRKFEKIIVYPMPFPSPEYPFAHASELYEPDGCMLFSAEQLMMAYMEPDKYYNIGLHEYAKAYQLSYPNEAYPVVDSDTIWGHLQQISNMSREHIEAVVGLAGVEALPVAIHHYFTFPDAFRRILPETARALDGIFGE